MTRSRSQTFWIQWIELLDASRGGENEYGMDIFVHRLGEYGMDIFIHHLVSRFDEKKHVALKMTPRVTMDDAEAMQLQQRAAAVSEFVLNLTIGDSPKPTATP